MTERDALKIDQCLFGYHDGHRMLESSLRLPSEVASDLTAASDVAPGTLFAASDGYWTGFPVPRLSKYGLMRTWPAPEMPRPGCVWTHLLLFDPVLFEAIDDLSCFEFLMRRPSGLDDCATYTKPISQLTALSLSVLPPTTGTPRPSQTSVVEILEVLYGGREGPVEIDRPGELDRLVLAVWSQQWPRLRRNFRFQTAASTAMEGIAKRFDLQFRIKGNSSAGSIVMDYKRPEWLNTVILDIDDPTDHRLRPFLRRYGQDVKRQRGSFRPLVEIFEIANSSAGAAGQDVPASVSRWFPDLDDASTLKRDFMDGAVLADAQIEAVLYLCEVDKGHSLPAPSETGLQKLAGNWPTQSFDLMRIAEWAAIQKSDLADALLSAVAKVIPSSDFWRVTEPFPEMRRRMVANQPNLLDAEPVVSLEPAALLALLDVVPAGYDVGAALVRRLPAPVDARLVKKAFVRFPATTLSELIEKANAVGVEAVGDWLREIGSVASLILEPAVMEKVRRASIVLAIAEALDWLHDDVVRLGLRPWMAGLAGARDDLSQAGRDRLEAFLFALAVSTGGEQAQEVFERSFGYLHDRIVNSYLPWQALRLLQSRLPNLGWMRDWDNGLKLRLAVTQAYVRYGLDPGSFNRLLLDKKERKMLRRAAEEVDGGDRFANILRD